MNDPSPKPSIPSADPDRFWNVPNALTLSRLALTPVVIVLIEAGYFLGAFIVFVLAAVTDALDGYVARLLNQTTALGRQLDPLIDKVVVAALYIELLSIGGTGVRAWMVIVIVARELLIQGLRSHLEGQGQAFGAKFAGKLKTFFQCVSIGAILLFQSIGAEGRLLSVRDALTWSAVLLTIYSGIGYVVSGFSLMKRPKPS